MGLEWHTISEEESKELDRISLQGYVKSEYFQKHGKKKLTSCQISLIESQLGHKIDPPYEPIE